MKKLVLLTAMTLTMSANAGLWEKVSTAGAPTVQSKMYKIDAAGWNLRAYEFTPLHSQHMKCVFVAGSKKGGVSCFPKQ